MRSSELLQKLEGLLEFQCSVCATHFLSHKKRHMVCMQQHPICDQCSLKLPIIHEIRGLQFLRCPSCKVLSVRGIYQPHFLQQQLETKSIPKVMKQYRLAMESSIDKELNQQISGLPNRSTEHIQLMALRQSNAQTLRFMIRYCELEQVISYMKQEVCNVFESHQELREWVGLGCLQEFGVEFRQIPVVQAIENLGYQMDELEIYDLLAFCCLYSEDTNKHEEWYKQMVERHTQNPQLLLGLANLQHHKKEYLEAFKTLQNCLILLPKSEKILSPTINCILRLLPIDRGYVNRLTDYIVTTLRQYPHNLTANIALSFCMTNEERVDHLEKLAKDYPNHLKVSMLIANFVSKTDPSQGIKCFEKILADHPNQKCTHIYLSSVYEQMGDIHLAMEQLELYLDKCRHVEKMTGDMAQCHKRLSEYYIQTQRNDKLTYHLRKMNQGGAENEQALMMTASLALRNDQIESAIDFINRLVDHSLNLLLT